MHKEGLGGAVFKLPYITGGSVPGRTAPILILVSGALLVVAGIGGLDYLVFIWPLLGALLLSAGMAGREGSRKVETISYVVAVPLNADEQDVSEDIARLEKFSAERGKHGVTYMFAGVFRGGKKHWSLLIQGSPERLQEEMRVVEALSASLKALKLRKSRGLSGHIWVKVPLGPGRGVEGDTTSLIEPPRGFDRIYPSSRLDRLPEPQIPLGRALNVEGAPPVGLMQDDLFKHVAIVGATGSGKTTTAATLARRSREFVSVVVIDWHNEYRRLVDADIVYSPGGPGNQLPLDVLDSRGIGSLDATVDMFEQVLGLTPPQAYALYRLLEEHPKVKSLQALVALLDASHSEGYWDREIKQALLRRIHSFVRGQARQLFKPVDYSVSERFLEHRLSVVEVGWIDNVSLRRLYVTALLKTLFEEAKKGLPAKNGLLVVVDEAHNVFGRGQGRQSYGFTDKLVAEVRKYRIGLVLVSQSPSSLSEEALKNTNTKVVHTIKSGLDKRVVTSSLGLRGEYEEILAYLNPGEAVLQAPSLPEPLIVKIEP